MVEVDVDEVELEVLDVDELVEELDVLEVEVEVVSELVEVEELVELVEVLVAYKNPAREVPSLIAPISQLSYW